MSGFSGTRRIQDVVRHEYDLPATFCSLFDHASEGIHPYSGAPSVVSYQVTRYRTIHLSLLCYMLLNEKEDIMRLLKSLAILCAASTLVGNTAHAQATNNDSVLTTVYNFVNGGFNYPQGAGGLVQATTGYLYGTTWGGGTYGNGTVFGISPS